MHQLNEETNYQAQQARRNSSPTNKLNEKSIITDTTQPEAQIPKPEQQKQQTQFRQYKYRWAVVSLAIFATLINGLANNNIIPVVSKITKVYGISTFYANFPVTITFLVFAIINFPANQLIDRKGLRFSFILGTALYAVGMFLFVFIDKGYYYAVMGAIAIAIGQPFIINCPAKIATFWFLSKNRTMATTMITAFQIIGSAVGFVFPASFISQNAQGQQAKDQFFFLYAIQFFIGALCFILVVLFMRNKPPTPPSLGASIQKITLYQSFQMIKRDRNLCFFILGYMVISGSFLSFGANSNLILHPYNYSDIQIALLAINLLVSGVSGAVGASIYVKKTLNYGRIITGIPLIGVIILVVLLLCLNFLNYFAVMMIIGVFMGSVFTPIIPISFDLMCQIGFPIGQAQAIGILTGSCMIWTFIVSNTFTLAIGLHSKTDSMIAMSMIGVMIFASLILFSCVKINLKRRQAELVGHIMEQSYQNNSKSQQTKQQQVRNQFEVQMPNVQNILEKNPHEVPREPLLQADKQKKFDNFAENFI